jgi:hypothetical protein
MAIAVAAYRQLCPIPKGNGNTSKRVWENMREIPKRDPKAEKLGLLKKREDEEKKDE